MATKKRTNSSKKVVSKSKKGITKSQTNKRTIKKRNGLSSKIFATSYFSLIIELLMICIAILYFTGYGQSITYSENIPTLLTLACYLFIFTIFVIIIESALLKKLKGSSLTLRLLLALLSMFIIVLSYFWN